ncbi:hypothetical protein NUW54_g10286 [Trametes sanguinea]|uniref:Uncharacterized protein n=1 Tax=Trametes sanguinea TaxID=158606 RepID=A0ACC1P0W6_9APHY|nr:hypothetical protein NUW54_g10286 [Trametes sanguinea]
MAAKKVLMLHGYAQNATIFSKRLGALRKTCGKDIDFGSAVACLLSVHTTLTPDCLTVFVDAPHVLTPADLAPASPRLRLRLPLPSPHRIASLSPPSRPFPARPAFLRIPFLLSSGSLGRVIRALSAQAQPPTVRSQGPPHPTQRSLRVSERAVRPASVQARILYRYSARRSPER